MSTHSLCFEQKYEEYQNFLSENFPFFVVKFSIYLYRGVFRNDICIVCNSISPANFCSSVDRNPENRFSHDVAQSNDKSKLEMLNPCPAE